MYHIIWCHSTVQISPSWTCHTNHKEQTRIGHKITAQNQDVSTTHYTTTEVLPWQYLLLFPGAVLWTKWRGNHGITSQPHGGKHTHEVVWKQGTIYLTIPTRLWKRYVDDTFVIQDSQHKDKFLQHKLHRYRHRVNSRRHQTRCSQALLGHNNTYTRGYTHHRGVQTGHTHTPIITLLQNTVSSTQAYNAKTVCSTPELLGKEIQTYKMLYPNAYIPNGHKIHKWNQKQHNTTNNTKPSNKSRDTVIPYIQSMGEIIQNIHNKYGIQTYVKSQGHHTKRRS